MGAGQDIVDCVQDFLRIDKLSKGSNNKNDMKFRSKLMQKYFDYFYNPVYDITTARLSQYGKLQTKCIERLDLSENDRVLCVGLGTGNELVAMLKKKRNVNITGIDYSKTALRKAAKKVKEFEKCVKLSLQDARHLEFESGSFDRVLCIHVMDFIDEDRQVTAKLLRVLRNGGTFAITYPSDRENIRMGFRLLADSIRNKKNSGKSIVSIYLESLSLVIAGIVYLPLLSRENRKSYKRSELEVLFSQISGLNYSIEEDPLYQDYIVFGNKTMMEGNHDAT